MNTHVCSLFLFASATIPLPAPAADTDARATASAAAATAPPAEPPAAPPTRPDPFIRVQSVEVIASPTGPVVVLNIPGKSIPVFVDSVVAVSIQAALTGQGPARPLAHDLLQRVLESFDAKATRVLITLADGTYRGALEVTAGGKPRIFDSRASDAIALALRFKAPILVHPSVVESAGVEQGEPRPGAL